MLLESMWMQGSVLAVATFAGGLVALPGGRAAVPVAAEMGPVDAGGGEDEHGHPKGAHLPAGRLGLFLAFAAGFLLSAALLHLLPEAVEGGGARAGLFAMGGFLVIHLLERYVLVHPCGESGCDFHTLGWTAAAGLFTCSAADGFTLASALAVSSGLTLPVFLAVALHRVLEAFVMVRLLVAGGRSAATVLGALAAFAVSTPATALLALSFLGGAGEGIRSAALGLSAGLLLAIATGDLLPEVHRRGPRRMDHMLAILLGVGLMAGLGYLAHGAAHH